MTERVTRRAATWVLAAVVLAGLVADARAEIMGVSGPAFTFTAKADYISMPDGGSIHIWGYANGTGRAQYPGPTMIVQQGQIVTVTLKNMLPEATSIIFPGQTGVVATGGQAGLVTREAPSGGGTVTYQFLATKPGTYIYQSGTRMEVQQEMGLFGALIVRPAAAGRAYDDEATGYDREYLILETEIDPRWHEWVENGYINEIDTTDYWAVNWTLNGRAAPDTMAAANSPLMPTQPYNCMIRMKPGERILLRFVNAGRQLHPFHTHGNNFYILARDGRMLSSGPGNGPNLAVSDFTITVPPGGTADCVFGWTGEKLGWDIYGHPPDDVDVAPTGDFPGPGDTDHNGNGILDVTPLELHEYGPDHGKPFPVALPGNQDIAIGDGWSGSPFLGTFGQLPPGVGGFGANAGYFYMWHSHKEKEMVNNNIFPGGMMTMLLIEPPWVDLDAPMMP